MSKKISELTELSEITGSDYAEVSEDDGAGGYVSKKWAPGTMANQNKDAVDIDGGTISFATEHDNGTVSANTTIDFANGNNQVVTLGADVTMTFSNMGVGHKQLRVVQDGTGGRVPTLPAGKWPGGAAGSFSTAAGAEDILSIYYDGSSYYYQLSKGWA